MSLVPKLTNTEYTPRKGYHLFKLRIEGEDKDFIEVEVANIQIPNYADFFEFCCKQFSLTDPNTLWRIRKLPHTRVRNDADIRRFQTYESFELILNHDQKFLLEQLALEPNEPRPFICDYQY